MIPTSQGNVNTNNGGGLYSKYVVVELENIIFQNNWAPDNAEHY